MMKSVILLASFTALAGCLSLKAPTGGSTPPPTPAALTGDVPLSATDGTPVTVALHGTTISSTVRRPSLDNGNFAAFDNGASPTAFGHFGTTASGNMSAAVAVQSSPYDVATTYARTGSVSMPTTGSATFTGKYVGNYRGSQLSMVTGDATLSVDFGAGTISGAIINRQFGTISNGAVVPPNTLPWPPSPPEGTMNDITLNSATIDSTGAFSGTISGGTDMYGGTVFFSNGTYEGLIGGGGSSPNEVVGSISRDDGMSTGSHTEYGVFYAQ